MNFKILLAWPLNVVESILKGIGNFFGVILDHPPVMVVLASLSYGCSVCCALKTTKWSWLMSSVIAVKGVVTVAGSVLLYKDGYISMENLLDQWARRYRATNSSIKAGGSVAVLVGSVYLSNDIENDEQLGLFAIGFFLSSYVLLVSIMKLVNMNDLFGAGDSLMAVSLMLWVRVSAERLKILGPKAVKYGPSAFFGVVFLLNVFKLAQFQFVEGRKPLKLKEKNT